MHVIVFCLLLELLIYLLHVNNEMGKNALSIYYCYEVNGYIRVVICNQVVQGC